MDLDDKARRRFLCVLGAGALCPSAVGCGGGPAEPDPIGKVDAGPASDYAADTLTPMGTKPVALGRDDAGFYAFTLTCTHEGCNMAVDGFVSFDGGGCGCHGAQYDGNGHVTHGPAEADLVHFAVSIDDAGNVIINGDKQVSKSTRTPVA